MKKTAILMLMSAALLAVYSCEKENSVVPPPDKPTDTVDPDPPQLDFSKYGLGDLAEMQGIKLGAAFTYQEYTQNKQVAEILSREFKAVTFGNEMKHDAIVQPSGVMNFTRADQMARWAKDAGTELFGHVLGWHSQQQKTYLNNLLNHLPSAGGDADPICSIDFEAYASGPSSQILESGEFVLVNGPDYVSVIDEYSKSGSLSLRMDNSDGHAVNSWDVQVVTKSYPVIAGKTYRISWYGRSPSGADIQIDIRGDGDVKYLNSAWGSFVRMGSDWTAQTLDYTVQSGQDLSVGFYGATEATIYYLDDIRIIPLDAPGGEAAHEAIDGAFKTYVYGMVEHFDTYAWDVVNETFNENGSFRTQQSTPDGFVWGTYYNSTKEWVDKAFEYATDAASKYGKNPVLYINDYNIETSPSKRKALCDYAKNNPLVTGVATQMHLDMATPDLASKIEASLKDLVATGKMVRIAELDIKTTNEEAQAELFRHIFQKYIEIVPAAQRGGITFWGINDKDSWVGEKNAPLLWKGIGYTKKKAYEAIYLYLCEVNGLSPYKE